MDPRVVFVDFRDNFGNFSSCFSLEKQKKKSESSSGLCVQNQDDAILWSGQIQVSHQEQLPLSTFHKELIEYEQANYVEEETKHEPEPE